MLSAVLRRGKLKQFLQTYGWAAKKYDFTEYCGSRGLDFLGIRGAEFKRTVEAGKEVLHITVKTQYGGVASVKFECTKEAIDSIIKDFAAKGICLPPGLKESLVSDLFNSAERVPMVDEAGREKRKEFLQLAFSLAGASEGEDMRVAYERARAALMDPNLEMRPWLNVGELSLSHRPSAKLSKSLNDQLDCIDRVAEQTKRAVELEKEVEQLKKQLAAVKASQEGVSPKIPVNPLKRASEEPMWSDQQARKIKKDEAAATARPESPTKFFDQATQTDEEGQLPQQRAVDYSLGRF